MEFHVASIQHVLIKPSFPFPLLLHLVTLLGVLQTLLRYIFLNQFPRKLQSCYRKFITGGRLWACIASSRIWLSLSLFFVVATEDSDLSTSCPCCHSWCLVPCFPTMMGFIPLELNPKQSLSFINWLWSWYFIIVKVTNTQGWRWSHIDD